MYYQIVVDDGLDQIEAASLEDALAEAEIPVSDAEAFEEWLLEGDGTGFIDEDGVEIARVGSRHWCMR